MLRTVFRRSSTLGHPSFSLSEGQAGPRLQMEGGATPFGSCIFWKLMARLNSFTSESKLERLRSMKSDASRHRFSGSITVFHCILLNLFCSERKCIPFLSCQNNKQNKTEISILYLDMNITRQTEQRKEQKFQRGKEHCGKKRNSSLSFPCKEKELHFSGYQIKCSQVFFLSLHKTIIVKREEK